MTRAYSLAFKRKMIQRLTGKDALSASRLARETGVRQQNLSRWLGEARSLPRVARNNPLPMCPEWTPGKTGRSAEI
jgi:transposase